MERISVVRIKAFRVKAVGIVVCDAEVVKANLVVSLSIWCNLAIITFDGLLEVFMVLRAVHLRFVSIVSMDAMFLVSKEIS